MSKKFDEILKQGARAGVIPSRTKAARQWYRKVAAGTNVTTEELLRTRGGRLSSDINMGDMVFFKYDAKGKGKLPFWDAFPLIFPFAEDGKYFMGLNVHYLPPKHRAILMDELYKLASDDRYNEKTVMRLSYETIKSFAAWKYAQPCIKRYLKSNVKSRFIKVNPNEWDVALFLPVADWQGATQSTVWADTRRRIRGA